MNHDEARQMNNGLWHYTTKNDDRVYPIGYCSPFQECVICHGRGIVNECDVCKGRGVITVENPCEGHTTREGAELHFYYWEVDHCRSGILRLDDKLVDGRMRCERCGEPTLRYMQLSDAYDMHMLCSEHQTREDFIIVCPFEAGRTVFHS